MTILRQGTAGAFSYTRAGALVRDRATLDWIASLRIPPAWTDVHIYTTGRRTCVGKDAAGRQQNLYTEAHRNEARKTKYRDLIAFGRVLPRLQADVSRMLAGSRLSRSRVVALVVRIVEHCNFRLGTLQYEEENDSFGITTIRRKHVRFVGGTARFSFIGKKGVLNECEVADPACIRTLRELAAATDERKDDHLMMYQEAGAWHHLMHTEVNDFLREYAPNITSKDFRTFRANLLFIEHLRHTDPNQIEPRLRRRTAADAIIATAAAVHNTPAVCKKDYIDPAIIDMFLNHPVRYRARFVTPTASAHAMFTAYLREAYGD